MPGKSCNPPIPVKYSLKSVGNLLRRGPQEISLPGFPGVISWDIACHDHQKNLLVFMSVTTQPYQQLLVTSSQGGPHKICLPGLPTVTSLQNPNYIFTLHTKPISCLLWLPSFPCGMITKVFQRSRFFYSLLK